MTSELRTRPTGRHGRRPTALVAAAVLALTLPEARAAAADEPADAARAAVATTGFEQQVLFKASEENGYSCFRIPAIVKTTEGTLLAFAEGRVDSCGDAGDIDLVLKRSTDGGRTWGSLRVVNEGDGDTHGNPAPVVDARTGRIVLATTYNEGRDDGRNCDVPCDRTPHLQYSDDDGRTWSEPRDLSAAIRPPEWDSWYATGPVHGIQLTQGDHAGRLLFSVNAASYENSRVTAGHAALAYSDDSGDTWELGAVDTWPVAEDGTYRQKPQEMTLLERSDGSIYVNGRENHGTDLGHRTHTVSLDGGESFARPFQAIPDLYTPVVQGSTVRLSGGPGGGGPGRVLFSAPADPDRRRTMMIRSSYDEGRTWESVDRGKVVTTDWSGYSDMVPLAPGTTGLLYEGGPVDARDEIRFAQFTEDWLGPRRGPDPTTPDRAPGARDAFVLGGADLVGGRFERALRFDGKDDGVRLPYRDTLRLGSGDFTLSLWFRYTASQGDQPFLWLGGVGARNPQVWVRGEPHKGRLRALMTAVEGAAPARTASVSTSRAYNDGAWHHLAVRRADDTLSIAVDGGTPVSVPAVPGTISRTSTFGVHVGEKANSRARLTGALDEVRAYARALSDAELARLGERRTPRKNRLVLDLPLDEVRQGSAR